MCSRKVMRALQNLLYLVYGILRLTFIYYRSHNTLQERLRQNTLLYRSIRGDNYIVLVLTKVALAFFGKDTNHFKRDILKTYSLPNRVFAISKEVLSHCLPYNSYLRKISNLIFTKHTPFSHTPLAYGQIFGIHAIDRGRPVIAPCYTLSVATYYRRYIFQ